VRFHFDERKSKWLRANPRRGIGFEEVQEIFSHPYYLDQRLELLEQQRAIGWVGDRLYTVIFEMLRRRTRTVLPPGDSLEGNPAGATAL
jgi:uncharacterized DUF497 family protein